MEKRRTALLMRHAEALPAPLGSRDFDRELSGRGHAAAAAVGHWIARHAPQPAHVWCSPARRARQTAEAVCRALAGAADVVPVLECDETLYLAEVPVLVDRLEQAEHWPVLVIGHNPGLAQLLEEYLPELAAWRARDALMPPAALFALELSFVEERLAHRGHRLLAETSPALLAPDASGG